jgi:quinol monooxygenase YgiN
MKIIRVQYTTTPEYVATNQANIADVANEVRRFNHPGIRYSAYLLPDGKTFMHFDQFENEEAHQALMGLESFKKFQAGLKESTLEATPQWELLTLVAASYDLFG